MKSERLNKAAELFHATLEREPHLRAEFLAETCGSDIELLREVESLLTAHEQSSGFMDSPAYNAAGRSVGESSPQFEIGRSIGHYRIITLIGRGGMGEVYLAQDTRLHRRVALKLLRGSLTRDKQRVKRFEQEACSASALSHPNIMTVHDIGQEDDFHFIATEYIEGETLRQLIKRGKISLGQGIEIAIQVSSALSTAHAAGIIHRDIKPENIMLRPDGYVKVLDFGLAKLSEPLDPQAMASSLQKLHTEPGLVIGTVNYMSPEQSRGKTVDARSDIFSLGIVLYETITGRMPFAGETASDVIAAILEKEPSPLTWFWPEVPPELQRIVSKTLRKDREERYQTIKDLLIDLKNLKRNLEFEAKLEHELAPEISNEVIASRRSGQTLAALAQRHNVPVGQVLPDETKTETSPPISKKWLRLSPRLKWIVAASVLLTVIAVVVYKATRGGSNPVSPTLSASARIAAGSQHRWSFDEMGGNALDSGNASLLLWGIVGSNVIRSPGRFAGGCSMPGNAIELTGGENSFVYYSNSIGQFRKTDFTVSFWMKTSFSEVNKAVDILSNRVSGTHGNYFSLRLTNVPSPLGRIDFAIGQGATAGGSGINFLAILSKTSGFGDGKWHHIVAIRQGVTAKLLIDGSFEGSAETQNNGSDIRVGDGITDITNGTPLYIGTSPYALESKDGFLRRFFPGVIDDLQIYDRALTDQEVADLYGGVTVAIGSCNSNVDNHALVNGCTYNDMIDVCRTNSSDHTQFKNCVNRLVSDWTSAGIITRDEKDRIVKCAESSSVNFLAGK